MNFIFNQTDISRLAIRIDNDLDYDSFSSNKYKNLPENEDTIQKAKEDLSRSIGIYKKCFTLDFAFSSQHSSQSAYNSKIYTRIEARIIIFLMLYPSTKGSFISKIKKEKPIELNEIDVFISSLQDFLTDERFLYNNIWYSYENNILSSNIEIIRKTHYKKYKEIFDDCSFEIEQEKDRILSNNDKYLEYINHIIENLKNYYLLCYYRNAIKENAIVAISKIIDDLIPADIIKSVPIYELNNDYDNINDEPIYRITDGIYSGETIEITISKLNKLNKSIKEKIYKNFYENILE